MNGLWLRTRGLSHFHQAFQNNTEPEPEKMGENFAYRGVITHRVRVLFGLFKNFFPPKLRLLTSNTAPYRTEFGVRGGSIKKTNMTIQQ